MVSLFLFSSTLTLTKSFCSCMSPSPLLFSPSHSSTTLSPQDMPPINSGDHVYFPVSNGQCISLLGSYLFPSFSGIMDCRLLLLCTIYKFTYERVHTMLYLLLGYLSKDGFSNDIHLTGNFKVPFFVLFFFCWVVVHCVNIPHFLYPFFWWGASKLLPVSGYYK